jgi:peptidoglycan/xylan/chitin deacetylase (PgdA/CDA1 family)
LIKRLIKLFVSLCLRGYDIGLGGLLRLVGRSPKPRCVVLYFHAVPGELRARFARQMDELLRLTQPVRCDIVNGLAPGRSYTAVSFDDGFISVIENALPELEARRIPATLFIPTGCLGASPSWLRDGSCGEKVVSAEMIARLKDHQLLAIGSHSVSHPNFLKLGQEEAEYELSRSRRDLEAILGRPIGMFSFPHGAHNSRLTELARQAGYRRVFTVEPELAFEKNGDFETGRVEADPCDWAIEFRLKLLGAYRWNTHRRK